MFSVRWMSESSTSINNSQSNVSLTISSGNWNGSGRNWSQIRAFSKWDIVDVIVYTCAHWFIPVAEYSSDRRRKKRVHITHWLNLNSSKRNLFESTMFFGVSCNSRSTVGFISVTWLAVVVVVLLCSLPWFASETMERTNTRYKYREYNWACRSKEWPRAPIYISQWSNLLIIFGCRLFSLCFCHFAMWTLESVHYALYLFIQYAVTTVQSTRAIFVALKHKIWDTQRKRDKYKGEMTESSALATS